MRQRGFSLIELLIVVAIILVIAAIAIPNLIRARIQANEASAVSSIRAVNTAQVSYATNNPTVGYADDLAKLGTNGMLDWVLGCAHQPCPKNGYQFSIGNVSPTTPIVSYSVFGTPTAPGQTGIRGFCSFQMNPVLFDPNGGTNCTEAMR